MARILLIDDDEPVRSMMAEVLRAAGHEVLAVADGLAGLESFRPGDFEVVVCDVLMPRKEGLETISELRRACPETRILVISGGGLHLWAEDCLELALSLGADRALGKPFRPADLRGAVDELLAPRA